MTEAPTPAVVAYVSDQPIDDAQVRAQVGDERAGAVVSFLGVVRNHDHGRPVTEIEYVGHPDAGQVLARVAASFADRVGVHAIAVAHRVGTLTVGEVAMAASVAASHRAEAFQTASDLVDRVKAELPVWKRQVFTDGSHEWTNCP